MTNKEPLFLQFRHNAKAAIEFLRQQQGGIAVAALHHPEIGDIDLRWGETSNDPRAKGYGLAKIIQWHSEVMGDLQGFILKLKVDQIHKTRSKIDLKGDDGARGGVKIDRDSETGHWLLTAYIKPSESKKIVRAPGGTPAALDDASGLIPATPNNTDEWIIGFEQSQVNFKSYSRAHISTTGLIRVSLQRG